MRQARSFGRSTWRESAERSNERPSPAFASVTASRHPMRATPHDTLRDMRNRSASPAGSAPPEAASPAKPAARRVRTPVRWFGLARPGRTKRMKRPSRDGCSQHMGRLGKQGRQQRGFGGVCRESMGRISKSIAELLQHTTKDAMDGRLALGCEPAEHDVASCLL